VSLVYSLQVGSADHHIHYYDLRRPNIPLHVFKGHQKAVSYVKFISPNELASASTDSTLRLWDVQENSSVRNPCFDSLHVWVLIQSRVAD
jgi:E3 ubiquitin-protein ligase RFWD2